MAGNSICERIGDFYQSGANYVSELKGPLTDEKLTTVAKKSFYLRWPEQFLMGTAVGIIAFPINIAIFYSALCIKDLAPKAASFVNKVSSSSSVRQTLLLSPIGEELLCRGMLLPLTRKSAHLLLGSKEEDKEIVSRFAVVLTALLFGVAHGRFNQAVTAVFAGLLYGRIATHSSADEAFGGNLMICIGAHMAHNTIVLATIRAANFLS